MKFEVYKITNLKTNKIYIGITMQGIENRFKKHINEAMNGSDRYLCKSFRKYGIENFTIEEIEKCDDDNPFAKLASLKDQLKGN